MAGRRERASLLALAGLLAGCGAAHVAERPRVEIAPAPRTLEEHLTPRPISLDEALGRARDEIEGELLAERREPLDGEARMHIVLEHGRCYRLWVGADGPVEVELADEHENVVASAVCPAWLDEVCPRWSSSFELVVASTEARDLAVLVTARAVASE